MVIPVIVARGWGEEEKQAYRLADNELAARGSWDLDLLRNELRDLKFGREALDCRRQHGERVVQKPESGINLTGARFGFGQGRFETGQCQFLRCSR